MPPSGSQYFPPSPIEGSEGGGTEIKNFDSPDETRPAHALIGVRPPMRLASKRLQLL